MSSTNKTTHLGLPQWEGTDTVEHGDFNGAFAKIDEAVSERLEFCVLRDLAVEPQDVSAISVDLSDLNLGDYIFVIVSTPQIKPSTVLYNGTNFGDVQNNSMVIFYPLRDGSAKCFFTGFGTAGLMYSTRSFTYSSIKNLKFLANDSKVYTETSKIRILGVR